ncbi:AhpC/TSA family protein [Flavobacterium alkalisoli]|uniref:AhpC/TSA family protein n=1 Tax=Flavobacterium alkalisoli TaxID=2602769 RepID=A0A5B9FWA9_9FLAO|nr:TlpA disulfide reductase family protein [Flavobacterium alkalisoli]QEE50296.1 AhpC/TSA family protein [Flavobacterium alkalisoli]
MKKFLPVAVVLLTLMSFTVIEGIGEYKISGTIDSSFNGKYMYLKESAHIGNMTTIDSALITKGKFTFKGISETPKECFLVIEGKEQEGSVILYTEEGNITVNVNKDTLFNSIVTGTFNNDVMHKFNKLSNEIGKLEKTFIDKNMGEFNKAEVESDTATINRVIEEHQNMIKENNRKYIAFIEENTNALVTIKAFVRLFSDQDKKSSDIKPLFDKLSAQVKETNLGKKMAEHLTKMAEIETAQAKVAINKIAPDFSAPTPKGKILSLKEVMGKVTIIDFWASWCGPCRKENPKVVAMYNELHDKGLNIVSVSLDQDKTKWKEAIKADELTWYQVSNLKGWGEPIAKEYGINGIPATFILDASGKIVAKNLRGEELKAKVKELLAQ